MSPLAKPTNETSATMQNYPPPTYLKHKPIFMVPYEPFDGSYSGDTDALYLSVGLAQYRSNENTTELSAKVWRMPDDKWSRMSEEIPLHRLADLCILLAKTFYQSHQTKATHSVAVIAAGTFENQNEALELRRMTDVPNAFGTDEDDRVKRRLRRLRDELNASQLD
jgi:Family of unknown function (DUF6530)